MDLNNNIKLRLKRSVSIRKVANGDFIFGMAPPRHFVMENPPQFLEKLLTMLNQPQTIEEVITTLTQENQQLEAEDIYSVLADLVDLKALEEPKEHGRYDRHELYDDIFNVTPEQYRSLKLKKVGLIGAGGIGSTCALLLTASGVGSITLTDDDLLEETNLPRVILLEEKDIGLPKIQQIKEKLIARNSEVLIKTNQRKINSSDDILMYFGDCDAWILSADTPTVKIQEWTNEASLKANIPYLSAGYAEIYGMIGPFFIPGQTPCHNCRILNGKSSSGRQLNKKVQATSYGPLNTIVSSIAVNEVIRFLLGLDIQTKASQLILNSSNYEIMNERVEFAPTCQCHSSTV